MEVYIVEMRSRDLLHPLGCHPSESFSSQPLWCLAVDRLKSMVNLSSPLLPDGWLSRVHPNMMIPLAQTRWVALSASWERKWSPLSGLKSQLDWSHDVQRQNRLLHTAQLDRCLLSQQVNLRQFYTWRAESTYKIRSTYIQVYRVGRYLGQ